MVGVHGWGSGGGRGEDVHWLDAASMSVHLVERRLGGIVHGLYNVCTLVRQ